MTHIAHTDVAIHELLAARWSPYSLDAERAVSREDMRALLEAARWTSSSYNAQPWRYVVGVKGRSQDTWDKICSVLLEGNQSWAKDAPVLMLGVVEHAFEHNGKPNKGALHDLGAAAASLTFEATARGISVHQMIGLDPDKAREVFGITGTQEPFTALAIGYPQAPEQRPEALAERDAQRRPRKSVEEIIIEGGL